MVMDTAFLQQLLILLLGFVMGDWYRKREEVRQRRAAQLDIESQERAKEEKTKSQDACRRADLIATVAKMNAMCGKSRTEYYFGVALRNETQWPIVVRSVMIRAVRGAHIGLEPRRDEERCGGRHEIAPGRSLDWVFCRSIGSVADPNTRYDNAVAEVEFLNRYGGTEILTIEAAPPIGARLTEMGKGGHFAAAQPAAPDTPSAA